MAVEVLPDALTVPTRDQLIDTFSLPPLEQRIGAHAGSRTPPEVDATTSAYGPDSPMLRALSNNVSFFNCYESLQLARTASPDHALVEVDGDATVSNVSFTSKFPFAVTARTPKGGIVEVSGEAGPFNLKDMAETPLVMLQ